jgi:pSer/pThr/pTyr-binding forkhead associated (FHA) protein
MNGTSVNGQKIWGLAPLQDGDLLEIGGQRFRYSNLHPQANAPARAATRSERASDASDGDTAALPALAAQAPGPLVPAGQLLLSGGPGAGQVFALNKALLTIGRGSECDVVIADVSISRRHAQVLRQETGWYVQDLGSRNGTAINGQRLSEPGHLEDGDTLTVGAVPLRYLATGFLESAEGRLPEEAATEAMPATQPTPFAEEATTATPTRALPPKLPTVPLRGREQPGPLRLPTRPLEQSSGEGAPAPEPTDAASVQFSNHIFRPRRLVADRAFLEPVKLPPPEQS